MKTKEHVLALLERCRGESISGAHIAKQLGVSRNAVWKVVRELERDGYRIEAVPNKGYCLRADNDILSVQGMLPFLSQKEAAGRIFIHASLLSTNQTAKEMAVSGAQHGTIVLADCQTMGKGRYGRSFYSPPGKGVYMSFVLHPEKLMFSAPTLVTAFAAVAVCEAVEAASGRLPQIKWVNDVFLDGKKICGILTEAVTDFESGNIQWIVVGIGVNFNASEADFPEDLRQTAGSVFPERNPPVTRNQLAAEIINRITIPGKNQTEMLRQYRSRLMMLGERIVVSRADETFEAVAVDIDENGRLLVKKDDGETIALSAGEIKVRKQNN